MNTNHPNEGLFPAELHAKVAADCDNAAAELGTQIEETNCPVRRARLETKQAQRKRNASFHRNLARRTTLHLWKD